MTDTKWTIGLKTAPIDRNILVRFSRWDCPAVMRYSQFAGKHVKCEFFMFVERVMADVADSIDFNTTEFDIAEWAEIPK